MTLLWVSKAISLFCRSLFLPRLTTQNYKFNCYNLCLNSVHHSRFNWKYKVVQNPFVFLKFHTFSERDLNMLFSYFPVFGHNFWALFLKVVYILFFVWLGLMSFHYKCVWWHQQMSSQVMLYWLGTSKTILIHRILAWRPPSVCTAKLATQSWSLKGDKKYFVILIHHQRGI